MITHTFRALQLLLQAIREIDNFEELERLRVTCVDLYADDDQTSLELDEIPDKYKIRRHTQVNPIWIAAGALVLAAVVAAVLIAIYGGTDEESEAASALIDRG